ncbi:MAG: hypothetical protein OEO79_03660 [Gemmatimonadota bacterium]|nr:hypothetical protein [Gemmatimonadota bacterium]MDH3421898.1 hypothetical protein [Gemmatimonadota bacterium]
MNSLVMPRPLWMTIAAWICAIGLVTSASRDLLFSEARDIEVWLGFEIRGWLAILTAPVHWAILGVGAWGFWTQRAWIVRLSAAYAFYVALSHLIWSEVSPNGRGWPIGLLQALAISAVAVLLLRAGRTRPEGPLSPQ